MESTILSDKVCVCVCVCVGGGGGGGSCSVVRKSGRDLVLISLPIEGTP